MTAPRAQLDGRDRHRAEAASGRPTTAAPRTRGMPLERGAHVVGQHLEAAADDRLVGAAEDPEEAVGVDAREVGGADPRAAVAELRGLHLEQALLVGAEHGGRRRGRRRAARSPAWARPTLPRLVAQNCSVVGEVPAGDAAAELGRAVGDQHGDAVLAVERVGVGRASGAVPETTERMLREVVRVEVGVEHHAQRRGHEARGRGAVAADGVDPAARP